MREEQKDRDRERDEVPGVPDVDPATGNKDAAEPIRGAGCAAALCSPRIPVIFGQENYIKLE